MDNNPWTMPKDQLRAAMERELRGEPPQPHQPESPEHRQLREAVDAFYARNSQYPRSKEAIAGLVLRTHERIGYQRIANAHDLEQQAALEDYQRKHGKRPSQALPTQTAPQPAVTTGPEATTFGGGNAEQ